MASWVVHLRVADRMLQAVPGLCETEYVVGNIAPDSGVPNEDWSAFNPPNHISHFTGGPENKGACAKKFAEKYLEGKQYDKKALSFYLGYYTHLLTDELWQKLVSGPVREIYKEEFEKDPGYIWTIKKDWYGCDFLYLRDHKEFAAYRIYKEAVNFENVYMEEYSREAFAIRHDYIIDFYEKAVAEDREYPFFTPEDANAYVEQAADKIQPLLEERMKKMSR